MSGQRTFIATRYATPAEHISWARSAARDWLATASICTRRTAELYRAQGVGRDWQLLHLPSKVRPGTTWLAGLDALSPRCARRYVGITHAAWTAENTEARDDE